MILIFKIYQRVNKSMEFNEAVQSIIDHNNAQVDEFNELFDKYEAVDSENEELLKKQSKTDEVMEAQHKAIKKNFEDNVALKQRLSTLKTTSDHQIKQQAKELKELKDTNKKLKSANNEKQKKIDRLMKSTKLKNDPIAVDKDGFINHELGWLYTIHQSKDEVLQIYPHELTLSHESGGKTVQIPLIYSDKSGSYISAVLNSDNDVEWSSVAVFEDDTPERTKNMVKKFLMLKPSKEVQAIAKAWLYKVNIMQNRRIKQEDVQRVA